MTTIWRFAQTSKALPFIFCFACLLALNVIAVPAKAEQQPSHNDQVSLIDYSPDPKTFSPALSPIANLISTADSKVKSSSKIASTKTSEIYSPIEKDLLDKISKINRAYQHEAYFLLGLIKERLNKQDEALAAYEKTITLRSDVYAAVFRHGMILFSKKNYSAALNDFREVGWRSKTAQHEVEYMIAKCLFATDDSEKGMKHLNTSISLNSRFIPARKLLIEQNRELLSSTPEPDKQTAIQATILQNLSLIYQNDPDDRDAALEYANLLFQGSDALLNASKLRQAETIAAKFANSSDFADEQAVKLLADINLRQGKASEAEQIINRGLKKSPSSAVLQSANKQLEMQKSVE